MSKTFVDPNLLVWEAYPSGGPHGFSENPFIVFNCLSNRMMRPRVLEQTGDEADAERVIVRASQADLAGLFKRSREIR
jgi:hypothetical protein